MKRLKLTKLNTIRAQAGFTLVELVVAMGLMSIFMIVITDIVTTTLNIRLRSESSSAVSVDGRFILARLDYDIQRSTAVTTPVALGGSGSILALTIGGVTYTYSLSGSDLQLVTSTGTTATLNGSNTAISALTFQKLGNVGGKETVKYGFTVTSNIKVHANPPESSTFTTTIGRR